MIKSKPWVWNKVEKIAQDYWETPDDQFLPIVTRWKEKNYERVLDLGCGTGRHAMFLAQNDFQVDAFDLSADGIGKLQEKIREYNIPIKTQVGDMLNLPYGESTFDCLVAFHAIHHTDLSGLRKTLENIHKILKPDGEAFITLTSKEGDSWQVHASNRIDNNTLIKTEGPEIGVPHTYLNYEEVIDALKDFSIIKIQQIISYLRKQNKKHAHFFILMKK